MKFRVIFLTKKHIFLIALVVILFICFAILFWSKNNSAASNSISDTKILKADFNGDNKEEKLYVKREGTKYILEAKFGDKTYFIKSDDSTPIGTYSEYWPMRITLLDVSRDKVPEIFVQASNKDIAIQHVFYWNNETFENAFSNSNNILGFIDCKNNKTPKVLSGRLQDDNIWLTNYIFLNYKFKNYNYESTSTFMGKDTIFTLIKYIQSLPLKEQYTPKDILSPNISSRDLAALDMLSEYKNTYIFQDGIFSENKCDKNGNVSEILWTLNFRGISNTDKNIVKNYTLNVILCPFENSKDKNYFKITSIYIK